jgi:hypothetical protein
MTDPLLEMKLLESEINGLIAQYQQTQKEYTENVTNNLNAKAGLELQRLNELNGQILQKIGRAKSLALLAIPIENENQEKIVKNIPNLKEKADSLSSDKLLIDKLLDEQYTIKGATQMVTLERQSNFYKYISMFFVSILIIGITIRAYFTDSTNSIELIIALIASLLIIYHLTMYFL